MSVNYPLWWYLKRNVKYLLDVIAEEEKLVHTGRYFLSEQDRWRPWIESQQQVPLVNTMIQTVSQDSDRSASRLASLDVIAVNIDMYAIGVAGEILPADQVAADRLDLLVAQVYEGLTRLKESDMGFAPNNPIDPVGDPEGPTWSTITDEAGYIIDRDLNFSLTYYDQEQEQSTGQYAPARWSFNVKMPSIPVDNNLYRNLEELNVSVKDETLEQYALKFTYDHS